MVERSEIPKNQSNIVHFNIDGEFVEVERHVIPVGKRWEFLLSLGFTPVEVMSLTKWPVSKAYRSALSYDAKTYSAKPEDLHLQTSEIEMCYIQCPNVGEIGFNGQRIENSSNAMSSEESVHLHHNCQETYIVLEGELTLVTDIDPDHPISANDSLNGTEFVLSPSLDPKQYQDLYQSLDISAYGSENQIKAVSFTTSPDEYHTVIHAKPGTKYLVFKTPSHYWNNNEDFDKQMHPSQLPPAYRDFKEV